MTIREFMMQFEACCPLSWSESWDASGLQMGQAEEDLQCLLLALDFDRATLEQAQACHANLVFTHHPPFFHPLSRLRAEDPEEGLLWQAARSGLAIYAAHTNWDAAPGGVSDQLMQTLGLSSQGTLWPLPNAIEQQQVFWQSLPECVVNRAQALQKAWLSQQVLPGYGRYTDELQDAKLVHFLKRINQHLQGLGLWLNTDEHETEVGRLACIGGAYDASWLSDILRLKIKTLVVGEIKHHQMQQLAAHQVQAVMVGHDVSERVVLHPWASEIRRWYPNLQVEVWTGLNYNHWLS